jgi:hypothetical protein
MIEVVQVPIAKLESDDAARAQDSSCRAALRGSECSAEAQVSDRYSLIVRTTLEVARPSLTELFTCFMIA